MPKDSVCLIRRRSFKEVVKLDRRDMFRLFILRNWMGSMLKFREQKFLKHLKINLLLILPSPGFRGDWGQRRESGGSRSTGGGEMTRSC